MIQDTVDISLEQLELFRLLKMKNGEPLGNILILSFYGASRPTSISTFNCGSICEHIFSLYNIKQKQQKFADLMILFVDN